MTQDEVINLMRSSRSEEEWNSNCNKVKAALSGYPEWWYKTIILSGVLAETSSQWWSATNETEQE